jgi:hypothetical protein
MAGTSGQPSLGTTTQVPPQRKGILSLDATETRPPTTCQLGFGGCTTTPHYTHELQFIDIGPTINNPSQHATTYTLYVSAAISKGKHRVVQMYYTSTTNTLITAVSGLLSILIMVVNNFFPKIDQSERVIPMFVRNANPILKQLLWCQCGRCTRDGEGKGDEEGRSEEEERKVNEGGEKMRVVENPVVDA